MARKSKPWKWAWLDLVQSERGPPSPSVRHTLICLGLHADNDGRNCFPSVNTLVKKTRLGKRTVQRALTEARKAGWLRRSWPSKPQKSCIYTLHCPPPVEEQIRAEQGVPRRQRRGATPAPGGGHTGVEGAPHRHPTNPPPNQHQTNYPPAVEGATPPDLDELAAMAEVVLGGGRRARAANRGWIEEHLRSGLAPHTIGLAIRGLRLAIDAGAVYGIEPRDSASLVALERMTDKGARRVLAVALEYAQKAQRLPEGTTPTTNDVKVLVETLAALKTAPGAATPKDVEDERKKLVELTRNLAG